MKEWVSTELAEVASPEKRSIISGPFGSNISSKYFVEGGVPVIRGNNLSRDVGVRFNDSGFVYITEDKANELGTWADIDDLIFTAAGTIGQLGIISRSSIYPRYIISNKQLRVTLNKDLVIPLFAYYWFSSPMILKLIENSDTGSTIPLINLSVLRSIPILLPPLPEQKAIASILSSLDDKIDLLHRQNKTLESMAETLFHQWFVEEADDSWGESNLSDYCEVIDCLHSRKPKEVESDLSKKYLLQVYNIGIQGQIDLRNKYFVSSDDFEEWTKKVALTGGEIIISKTGRVAAMAQIPDGLQTGIGRNLVAVRANKKFNTEYLRDLMLSNWMKRKIHTNTSDGTILQSLHVKSICSLPVIDPPEEKIKQYSTSIAPIHKKLNSNILAISLLEKLRDTLLPKLMSGEVRVEYDE